MAAPRSGVLWLLVLGMLVTSLASPGEAQPRVFDIPCCRVLPDRTQPSRVECICEDDSLTSLRKGDLPRSVQSVSISTRSRMSVHREAIYDLTSLEEFTLYDMDTLEVHAEGLKLAETTPMFTFAVDNVRHVEFIGQAFSGYWNRHARIRIQATNATVIRSGAFRFSTAHHGPSLSLKHIGHLQVSSGGIASKFSYLTIAHSSMQVCENGAFGSNIRQIEIKNVAIDEAKEGCIKTTGGQTNLSIRASRISRIRSRAFSGNFAWVTVVGTNATTVEENGFQLNVERFELGNSRFDELKSTSFSIEAKKRISLRDVTVNFLQQNALSGLQIQHNDPDVKSMVIRNLNISHAQNGSLAFNERAKVTLYNLIVRSPFLCPVEEWARMLVTSLGFAASNVLSSQPQQEVLHQLQPRIICEDPAHPTLIPSTEPPPDHDEADEFPYSDNEESDDDKVDHEDDSAVTANYDSVSRVPKHPTVLAATITPRESTNDDTSRNILYGILAIVIVLFFCVLGALVLRLREDRSLNSSQSKASHLVANSLLPGKGQLEATSLLSGSRLEGSRTTLGPESHVYEKPFEFPLLKNVPPGKFPLDLRALAVEEECSVITIDDLNQPVADAVLRRRLARTGSLTRSVSAGR